jgi:hypothetical protein
MAVANENSSIALKSATQRSCHPISKVKPRRVSAAVASNPTVTTPAGGYTAIV